MTVALAWPTRVADDLAVDAGERVRLEMVTWVVTEAGLTHRDGELERDESERHYRYQARRLPGHRLGGRFPWNL